MLCKRQACWNDSPVLFVKHLHMFKWMLYHSQKRVRMNVQIKITYLEIDFIFFVNISMVLNKKTNQNDKNNKDKHTSWHFFRCNMIIYSLILDYLLIKFDLLAFENVITSMIKIFFLNILFTFCNQIMLFFINILCNM